MATYNPTLGPAFSGTYYYYPADRSNFRVNALTEFQIAPFLDIGTVFRDASGIRAKYLQTVPGVAFRAVVKPTVVGRVEVGVGKEGPATFVGIDYPL